MSEHIPTPKFWRAPTGLGLTLLLSAVILASADYSPLWSIPVALILFWTASRTASYLHQRSYLRQLRSHVNRVPLAGIGSDGSIMRLTDVYIDIAVKPAETADSSQRPFVGTARRSDRRRSFLAGLRRRRTAPIVVVGEPGSGKTTALHRTALQLARHRRGKRRLPIVVDLPGLVGTEPLDLPRLMHDSQWLTRRPPDGWFKRQLSAGRCVVMFDGLDELDSGAERQRVADWIEGQRLRYPRNTFVVTSRPDGLDPGPLPDAEFWQLRHLTDSQIASFLHDWCEVIEQRKAGHSEHWARDEGAAEAGVLLLRLRAKPALHELAAHPLPLTLVALVHRHCGILPDDREQLFADAIALLVNGHADTVHRLARHLMDTRSTRLSDADVHAVDPRIEAREFVAEAVASGWLTATADGRHAFTHLSLQQYLSERAMSQDDLLSHIDDPWWRDTILLWAERANVTPIIETCLASGTISALALAYDAADARGELEPALLAELRELLSLATKTSAENRLVGAAKVAQELSDMTPLFGGARLARRPVSSSLYSSFLEAEYPAGRPPPEPSEDSPATGLWWCETGQFLDWVNGLPRQDNTRFRLPTEDELAEPQCHPDIAGHSVWMDGHGGPRLYRTSDTPDPYAVAHDWWPRAAAADRRRMTLSLYQLAIVLGSVARPLSRDLAGEMNLDRERAYDLPRDLKKDTELIASRGYLNVASLAPGGADVDDPAARPQLDRIIELVAELAAKALDFRGDPDAAAHENLPFTFLDRLPSEQHQLLSSAVAMLWFASDPPRDRVRYGTSLSRLDKYWARGVFDAADRRPRTVSPDALLSALKRSASLLEDGGDTVWHELARDVLSRVVDRLTTTLTHNTSYTVDEVACARIAMTAVAAVVSSHTRQTPHTIRVLDQLATVQAGLTVLDDRATGRLVPNEVLLLIRN